jgi:uncharacterized membrane protein
MGKNRTEAFSDGVFAIIITIMVLELKVPKGDDWAALATLFPALMSYILSFIYVGMYWNNHHHMMHLVNKINGAILWANLHLLFWISMFPFVTGWMGENHFSGLPSAVYGFVLMMAGVAYWILERVIINAEGNNSRLGKAIGTNLKEYISVGLYALAIASTLFYEWIAEIIYITVAVMWLIPDRRIERNFS